MLRSRAFSTLAAVFCFFLSVPATAASGQNLAALKKMEAPASIKNTENPENSFIRFDAVRDTALALGSRAGMLARAEEINVSLRSREADLDRIYNFTTLFLREKVMPPVVVEARDSVTQDTDRMLRTADRIYRIDIPERLVTVVPTWRDYLYTGLIAAEPVGQPHAALLPRDENERAVWERGVEEGWSAGQRQADAVFDANMARLRRDYEGMLRYMLLLARGMITKPAVAASHSVVTGDSKEMKVNDTVYAITKSSGLVTKPESWSPTVVR